MSEPEGRAESGNLSAVQSISAKLLEVTRLAERLDARLCDAGARSQPLDPAAPDQPDSAGGRQERLDVPSRTSERSGGGGDSAADEYVTATECSSVPRSRAESFLSSEYEDALNPTTCVKAEDEATKKHEIIPVIKCEGLVSTPEECKSPGVEAPIEYKPDSATVIHRTIQDTGGKVVKEVTETTTLRVSHDHHLGVKSYQLVASQAARHEEHADFRELQRLERSCLPPADEPEAEPQLRTHRQELTRTSPTGLVGYAKSVGNGPDQLAAQIDRSGEYLRLKVLDVQPELTRLGSTADEAKELLHAHDDVLLKLQNKQSPVEELLRQADRVISTQKPKAEVYKAMAENLATAWTDVNELLEKRKHILERNVLFQCRAAECKESMRILEAACNDAHLPIEIEEVKNCLRKIHELRKTMLENLMGSLKDGKILLDLLREIVNEGTLDSRPDRIRADAVNAMHKVEGWLEELHDKRRSIELLFQRRKTQLEQCLALALLGTDLRELEEVLGARINRLNSSADQLGDSVASAELLLFELKKLQTEAKDLQDRAIKITKSTEQLVSAGGHFASEQATGQAYAILGSAADYINDLDQYEQSLERAIGFFKIATSVLTKLDQLEVQLTTTEHLPRSPGLARLHSQSVKLLEDVTIEPLSEGHALLEAHGTAAPGAEGVRRTVAEIEERKTRLLELCTAHQEENVRISRCLGDFIEKYEELSSWLSETVEAFLRGHQDMGSDLTMARNFHKVHAGLLDELERRAVEVDQLEHEVVPAEVVNQLQDAERSDVLDKVEALRSSWTMSRSALDARLQLASMYVDFHRSAAELEAELDLIEHELNQPSHLMNDATVSQLEARWAKLQPIYQNLTLTGTKFLKDSAQIVDSYLDVPRACLCVQTLIDKFANRHSGAKQKYDDLVATVAEQKHLRIEREKRLEQSVQTIEWVSKFREQLYPVVTCESAKPSDILDNLESSKAKILPKLDDSVVELDRRIKSIEGFGKKDDSVDIEMRQKLSQVCEQFRSTTSDYKSLLEDLISIYEKLSQVEQEIDAQRRSAETSRALGGESLHEVRSLLERLDSFARSMSETFKRAKHQTEKAIVKVQKLEPPDAARSDIDKLSHSTKLVVDQWNEYSTTTRTHLQDRHDFCLFGDDLDKINAELRDLAEQLATITGWLGESLSSAKAASDSFSQFEKTLDILDRRVVAFIKNTEESAGKHLPKIQNELTGLGNKLETLKNLTEATRKKINLSIQYFELVEEAKDWFKEGSKLLIVVARKATSVKVPEDASSLLRDIDDFLKPGEEKQEQRIGKIRELSTKVFGTERLGQFGEVVVENREMLDSFAIISSELRSLGENLRNAEELKEKLERERRDADARLREAQAAAAEAECARRLAEQLTAETLEEARRVATVEAQRRDQLKTASAQTDLVDSPGPSLVPGPDQPPSLVRETVKKEIHIVEKTEIEEQHVVSTVKQEHKPIIESAEIMKEETISREGRSEQQQQQRQPVPEAASEARAKPEFSLGLCDATVQEGERFTLECRVAGQPRPQITWHKDAVPISGNPDYPTEHREDGTCSLTIEETFAEDSGCFSCRATNAMGTAETRARITVGETSPEDQLSPASFVKELSPSTAQEGSAHRLECHVQGNPLPTVQWFKNDANIDNSPDYATTYNNGEAILKFDEVCPGDQATYSCKAANRIGQATTSATLAVQAAKPKIEEITEETPPITEPPMSETVDVEEKIIVECEPVAPTQLATTEQTQEEKSMEETVAIEVERTTGRSEPEEPPAGPGSQRLAARPTMEPRIQLPLNDMAILEGQPARLDCVIVGQPEPEVIWYHDEQPVKESADFQLLFQGDRCSLVIHEAFLDDAGTYKVVAINAAGEASSECNLKITPGGAEASGSRPRFVKLLSDLLVAEGEQAVLECWVAGEPEPELSWSLNGEPLEPSGPVEASSPGGGHHRLVIRAAGPQHRGCYAAKATNRLGEAKSFAKLAVRVLGEPGDELVPMCDRLVAPFFKDRFHSRSVAPAATTKFECIPAGKPQPKIQWLFNDRPVHGKDFLVSVSGDRQVLTIPEVEAVHAGKISCVAENAAGKAVCEATIQVGGGVKAEEGQLETTAEPGAAAAAEMQATSSSDKFFASERTTGEAGPSDSHTMTKTSSSISESSTTHTSVKKEYVTTTSSSTLSSCPAHPPTSFCLNKSSHTSEQSSAYNGAPPVVQSQKIEEYERIVQDAPDEIRQEKTVIVTQDSGGVRQKECKHQVQIQKPCRKQTAPRFVSPVTGMIVDQGSDIVLEGIVDGFPLPTITWTKNGQEVTAYNGTKLSYDHNHVKLEIKDVKVKDAGRYTCTAKNEMGNASSTADLVVKKTIFPPVFGRRLQAQVVKKGDRVVMEVEITGTPDPEITWYKDDEPLISTEFAMKRQGNSYYLFIDKAEKEHSGKYMARAANAGGEAQSIADFAVFEPTPDTMVEMHKTLVYENLADKNARKPCCGQPTEIPGANLTTEQITTTMIQPSAAIKTPYPSSAQSSTIRTIKSETTEDSQKASRVEMISSSVESHKSETKSEQKFHMKLEHKPAPFDASMREEKIYTTESTVDGKSVVDEQSEVTANENVETSTMARKDALNFFESMSKGSDSFSRGPRGMIKLTDEDDGTGPGCDVRVDQLTKNYERSTKFEEAAQETPKPDIKAGKKAVQDIFNKFEKGSSQRGIDNTMFDFPYEEFKLAPLECTRTVLEDVTASGSPIHGTLTISRLAAQSESAEAMMKGFNLVPEPPPEIGYAPKPEETSIKRQDVSTKARQLQESFEKSHSPIDVPIGGVKIFPTAVPKSQPKPQDKAQTRPLSIPPPFDLGKSSTTSFTDKKEWTLPEKDYKVSSSESKQEVELKPEYRMTQITTESSSSLEKKSFGSKEINVSEKRIERPPSPPKPKPIIYNAETIKVDHTVNTIEEKSVTQKYSAECDVHKTETTEKKYEAIKKQTARPWPDSTCDLRAPALVKSVSDQSKSCVKMYHQTPESSLQPGSPPEMCYTSGPPYVRERKVERVEKTYGSKPSYVSPSPAQPSVTSKKTEEYISRDYNVCSSSAPQPSYSSNKFSKSTIYSESEYESEVDNALRTSGYRRVQAPVSSHSCRPRSTESEPLPPSSFEVPSTNLTGPPRPTVTPTLSDSIQKSSSQYERQISQKSQQYGSLPKPGSPPVYVQQTKPTPVKAFKPESPKLKTKSLQQESGYMADTDEPLKQKSFSESCSSYSELKSSFLESKSYSSSQQKNDCSSSSYSQSYSYSSAPKSEVQRSSYVEKIVEKPEPRYRPTLAKDKSQGPQASSRFARGEFRESDYESDYDSSRISSQWKPQPPTQTLSDTKSSSSVKSSSKSSFSSSGTPSAVPSSFAKTTKETFSKRDESFKEDRPRAKSVLLPGSPPEMAYAPPRQSYYEGHSGVPLHNAVGTETKKTVRMDESTESTRRIVTVEQTSRVIKFGDGQTQQQQPPNQSSYQVPMPRKFVQGQFRESDYESDVDTSRIRPKWAPSESETEEPRYRKVQPPKLQKPSSRSPIITMPSDTETEKSESERRSSYLETTRSRYDLAADKPGLKPGSPPEYAFAPGHEFNRTANHVASKHINDMTSSFKLKTEQFSSNIQSDLKKRTKPILKGSAPMDTRTGTDDAQEPRTYREESRVAQYGTKQVDPETGLIYFKYDFGYEFGIVLPGEGKQQQQQHQNHQQRSLPSQRKPGDIDVPIVHEFTGCKQNGFGPTKHHTFPRNKSTPKFGGKSVKWEPNSESEFSEVEDARGTGRKMSAPSTLHIPTTSSKWEPTSPSPASLSPSLPSVSPHFGAGTPSNIDSTPGSPWSATNGERIIPVASEVVKPYIEILQKKAPLFITPLRDIAVVSGQTARFECIVQAEPQPNIIWSKDGRIVENSADSEVYYRNGVCRLTLPRTTCADAGTYGCTATNSLGSSVTSACLHVPGNRRSVYGVNY